MKRVLSSGKILPALALCAILLCLAAAEYAETEQKKPDDASLLPDTLPKKRASYSGSWLWAEGDERFSLTLVETNGKLLGYHSITRKSGSAVDTVSGRLRGNEDDDRSSADNTIAGKSRTAADKSMEQHVITRKNDEHMVSADADRLQPSISGEVHGPIVVVRFRSGQPGNESYGHARLTLRDRYLYWQVMDRSGESYFPSEAVLIRQPGKGGE